MKIIFIILGIISMLLGVLGIALPLLPTTPFLLLSATLFVRSSPRLYAWLLGNPLLGGYIRDYREKRAIPLRAKVGSVTLVWVSLLYCAFVVLRGMLWAQALCLLLAVAITWHLLSLGTSSHEE